MVPINPLEHVVYQILNAQKRNYPFPHFYIENVFPDEFYNLLLKNLPDIFAPLPGGFKHREGAGPEGTPIADWDPDLLGSAVFMFFGKQFQERFPNKDLIPRFRCEFRFIRDEEGYSIGPHTDAVFKVASLLFYLPRFIGDVDMGTGIYVPDDRVRTCKGGPHYDFPGFKEVFRAPYRPNSCLGFWKTSNSWHAVQEISRKIQRDVLLFNIYAEKP